MQSHHTAHTRKSRHLRFPDKSQHVHTPRRHSLEDAIYQIEKKVKKLEISDNNKNEKLKNLQDLSQWIDNNKMASKEIFEKQMEKLEELRIKNDMAV